VNCSTVTIVSCVGEIPGAPRTGYAAPNCSSAHHPPSSSRTRIGRAPFGERLPRNPGGLGRHLRPGPGLHRHGTTPCGRERGKTTAHQSSATPGSTAGSICRQGRDQGKRPVPSPEQALGCGTRAVAAAGQRPDGQPRAGPSTVCGRNSLWSPARFTDPQGGGRSDAGVVVVVVRRELSDLYSAARCQRRQPAVGPRVLQGGSGGAPVGQAVQAADRAHRVPDDL
jgi:hypothetical protein